MNKIESLESLETFENLSERLGHFVCPECEATVMDAYIVNTASTATPPMPGDTVYVRDGQKRKVILAYLECPACHNRLPINSFKQQ